MVGVEMEVWIAGMGVVVERICVGWGWVGGRKGVSVAWGAQAEAKIKTDRTANNCGRSREWMRSIS
jgi:hypothetical protein